MDTTNISNKVVIQGISITVISKAISLISVLYIARVLPEKTYGIYTLIGLILSYLPILQFGSMNGISINLPKEIEKNRDGAADYYSNYNTFSIALQLIISFGIFFFKLDIPNWLVIVIILNFIFSKIIENAKIWHQSHLEFSRFYLIKSFEEIGAPLLILILFFFQRDLGSIFIAQLVNLIIVIGIVFSIQKLHCIFSTSDKFFSDIKNIYKTGFLVFIVWVFDIFFRSIDRWFVVKYRGLTDLAAYGFASNTSFYVWMLSLSFIAPYVQLLYKYVAQNNFQKSKELIISTNRKLYILLGFSCVLAIVCYPFFLEIIVKKYFDTFILFSVLIGVNVLLSISNMYIYYIASTYNYLVLIKYQILIFLLNIILNFAVSCLNFDIIFYAVTTFLSLLVYYYLLRKHVISDFQYRGI